MFLLHKKFVEIDIFCQNVKIMETKKPKRVSGFPNGGLNAGKNY